MCVTTDKENTHETHDRSNVNENIVELRGDWKTFVSEVSRDYGADKRPVSLVCQNADALWKPDDHYYAFLCLQRLQSLRFAPGTKSIAAWHFYGCSNLQQLHFPNGLEKIGAGAFANCTALEEVVIPESVTEIEPKAFFKCTALRRVQISDTLLQTLDDSVFAMTPWMQMRLPEEPLHRFNDVLVASLGSGASYVLPIFTDKMNGEQDLLLIDANNAPYRQSELHATFLSKEKTALFKSRFWAIQPKPKHRYFLREFDPTVPTEILCGAKEQIRSVLHQYRFVIIVAALGGRFGSHVPLLAQWLREMELPYAVVASIPFPFEGKRKLTLAQAALNELVNDPVTIISGDHVKRQCAEREVKLTLLNAFPFMNEEIICQIQNILVHTDLSADFREQLRARYAEVIKEIENTMSEFFSAH